ncbi:MAG TPA: LacI family DNA-binding transcriptional regulator [Armatimonadaceae bacterium]|jgi:DNA-binding LacI/PurR family transcriptional regulator|nr:LacI family DNA-binding transcriptional regulator [Armatimonadaceae bacterium]
MAQRTTIQDIARHLGVSKGTVSMALNDAPGVNADTRQRVKDYARSVRYRPNKLARAINTGRSHLVAVLLSRLTDSFYEEVVQGIENVAAQRGYDIIVSSVVGSSANSRSRNADELVDRLISRQVDGIIGSIYSLPETAMGQLNEAGVAILYLGPEPIPEEVSVTVDNVLGGRLAAEHLYELGHRRVLFVGGDERFGFLRSQGAGMLLAERDGAHLEVRVLDGEPDMEAAYYAMATRLRARRDFTAVFCASDLIAVGVCKALQDAGVSVPGDVSVVGFDDLRWAKLITPALTTVHQPQVSQGEAAMDLLVRRIEDGSAPSRVLTPRLIVRDSTGPAPGA